MVLLDAGVNVAIGVVNESTARNTRLDIAWVDFLPPPYSAHQLMYL